MSLATLLGIGVLGGLGALARVTLDGAVSARAGRDLPFGLLAVNVLGALALGLLAGAAVDGDRFRLVATGLLGAFTTFSTWMLDSERLGPRRGAANVAVSLALGLLAVWLGRAVGRAL